MRVCIVELLSQEDELSVIVAAGYSSAPRRSESNGEVSNVSQSKEVVIRYDMSCVVSHCLCCLLFGLWLLLSWGILGSRGCEKA